MHIAQLRAEGAGRLHQQLVAGPPPPPPPTVAPTRVPTVHSLTHSLLLPLPVSLLYLTHSLPTVAPTRVPTVHSLPPSLERERLRARLAEEMDGLAVA